MQKARARSKTPRRRAPAPRTRRAAAPARPAPRPSRRPSPAGAAAAVIKKSTRRPLVSLSILVVLVASLLGLPSVRGISLKETQLWNGYQTVLLRSDRFRGREIKDVAARLGPGVVSDVTSFADFWDFSGIARARYADLDARLDPLDPRRDGYIDGAKGYFGASWQGASWRVLYVPAARTGLCLYLDLSRLLGLPARGGWRLVDFDPLEKAVSIAALFGLVSLLALSLAQGRRTVLGPGYLSVFLWVPFVVRGGLAEVALALGLLLAWFPLLRAFLLVKGWDGQLLKGVRKPLLVFCAAAAAGLALSLLAADGVGPRVLGLLSTLAACFLALPAIGLVSRVISPWWKRRSLFEPVPIVRPAGDVLRGGSVAPFFALIALVVVAVLPVVRGASLPTPTAVIGARDFSWQSLQRLGRASRVLRLPDLSDLVTHAAYQETMAFGRPWRLPSPDERVYVREFSANPVTGVTVSRLRCVKVFDETWRKAVRRRAEAGSLEALLFSQGRPVASAVRGSGRTLFRAFPVTLGVLIALLVLLARDLGLGPLIRTNILRSTVVARRNQIP
jgi:hypothetical protein